MTRATGGTGTRNAPRADGESREVANALRGVSGGSAARLMSGGNVAEVRALAGSPVAEIGDGTQAEGGEASGGSGAAVACRRAVSGGMA